MSSRVKTTGVKIGKSKLIAGRETMRVFQNASFRMRFKIAMAILFPPKYK